MSEENKIPLIMWADIKTAPLGQTSKLLDDFRGEPLLRQTLLRVCQTQNLGRKIVFCLPAQAEKIKSVLAGLPVEVITVQYELPGWWRGMQASRKWALDCWRGGLIGACAFDEDLIVHVVADLARRFGAKAIMTVNAHAGMIDPAILDAQVQHYLQNQESMKINFTQAPPGLAGFIIETDMLENISKTTKIAGAIIGYHPDRPEMDLISKSCNLPLEPSIIQKRMRLICDTRRSFAADAAIWPKEIEIELATGWPWKNGYRPTPATPRGFIDAQKIIKRVSELASECDDLLIYIGGFGEPTNHPQFCELIDGLKQAGAFGIALGTTALIDPALCEKIIALPIDIINLLIDIPDKELYQKITGVDGYQKVIDNINLMMSQLQSQKRGSPLIVPEMIKTHETMELMDEFFDGWFRKVGWSVIRGYSDYAGQRPDLSVASMGGPKRKPCRQLFNRMTILADGNVTICNQDFNKTQTAGSIKDQTLVELWQGNVLKQLRQNQLEENFSSNPLCEKCRQWHEL